MTIIFEQIKTFFSLFIGKNWLNIFSNILK
jgi:hypothetical protein